MSNSFIYVTYIRTTPQKLWDALTSPEFQRKYWFGMHQETDWKKGSPWALKFTDGRTADAGEVLEIDPPKRLVLKWRNEWKPELTEEGWSRCVYDLEPDGAVVRLTVTHTIEKRAARNSSKRCRAAGRASCPVSRVFSKRASPFRARIPSRKAEEAP